MVLRVVSRRWSRLVLVLVGLAALATCGSAQAHAVKADSARQIESQSARRITVGAVLDLSAGWTALGQSSRVALRLAVSDANAALRRRGLADRVVLRISDAAGSPAEAARAVRRLARAGARIIVGPEGSSEVAAAKPVADELKVILVSQGSTAHSLAVRDWVFRFVPDDVQETQAAAALIAHDGVSAIVPIWRDDAGNAGLASSIRPAVSAEGGTVSEGVPYASDGPDFPTAVQSLSEQVGAAIAANGAEKTAVFLAGFDEVVDLLVLAANDPVLSSVRWYGSDGVALTPALIANEAASAFAAKAGYPNPTLGLDEAAERRSAALRARIEADLGRQADAFTLAAYDALRVGVDSIVAAGRKASKVRLRRAFIARADGYLGMSGLIELNSAGDRAFGSFDFFSVCPTDPGYEWLRTWSFLVPRPGSGTLVERSNCTM